LLAGGAELARQTAALDARTFEQDGQDDEQPDGHDAASRLHAVASNPLRTSRAATGTVMKTAAPTNICAGGTLNASWNISAHKANVNGA
jgi:hypothetical protein